ncbi:MAG: hypothetical protein ACP5EQ_07570, partial [Candidatus Cloacimonadia bacterium]
AQHGGLNKGRSKEIMEHYLKNCDIPIEIYEYDPKAPDDLFEGFKHFFLSKTNEEVRLMTGLKADKVDLIYKALRSQNICQINQIVKIRGIGQKTLEQIFILMQKTKKEGIQNKLDFG